MNYHEFEHSVFQYGLPQERPLMEATMGMLPLWLLRGPCGCV